MSETQQKETANTDGVITVFRALVVLILGAVIGYFVYTTTINTDSRYPFRLGLDLAGGSHLVYEADVSALEPSEVPELMSTLREVIERRVNIFGVSEPIVQVERSSIVAGQSKERLVVELPGVSDVKEAIAEIGKTPLLEFRLIDQDAAQRMLAVMDSAASGTASHDVASTTHGIEPYVATGLTGRYLTRAELVFGQSHGGGLSNEPIVSIRFDAQGGDLFEQITRDNVGEQLAIFLDGELVSAPVINEAIAGGSAIISGNFTPDEARNLVRNLNFGALPVPIALQSTQTIGASLGEGILEKGIRAGVIGLSMVIVFMLVWYRLPGSVASISLLMYAAAMLALFKLIPVTLTAAGLAGFILSVGMAVDANILVFERMKEEYRAGKQSREAARLGFARAWSAIRDGNITSLLSATVLFWFGTSIVKGFALVFGIGVLVSMFTALFVTRTLLLVLPDTKESDDSFLSKLYGSGLRK
ncbi:MAG: protein translocase subunit SecD [Candidatus Pacebacteria bacterium]|nr:protein translocase subunit SecD [Candidatus Paceibacterota bacterium]